MDQQHKKSGATVLPDTDTLYEKYKLYRERYFGDKLPPANNVTIGWSLRMTSSAGNCRVQRNRDETEFIEPTIHLSIHYHQKHPDEIDSTLLHEMIHILVSGHGNEFKSWLNQINRLGGNVSRHSKEPAAPAKWVYICSGCGKKIYRRRRFKKLPSSRYTCKLCGGRWTENKLS